MRRSFQVLPESAMNKPPVHPPPVCGALPDRKASQHLFAEPVKTILVFLEKWVL